MTQDTQQNNRLIAEFMGLKVIGVSVQDGAGRIYLNNKKTKSAAHGRFKIEKAFEIPENHQREAGISMWVMFGKEHFLRYHYDWNWLMSVIEKIEGLSDFTVSIGFKDCLIQTGRRETISYTSNWDKKIDGVYVAVVNFIKWYNQTSKS